MLQDAGKYVILFFYPADFTFVCPSEIVAFSDRIEEFQEINTEVSFSCGDVALSIDRLALHSGMKVQANSLFFQLRYAQFFTVHSACLVFCAFLATWFSASGYWGQRGQRILPPRVDAAVEEGRRCGDAELPAAVGHHKKHLAELQCGLPSSRRYALPRLACKFALA